MAQGELQAAKERLEEAIARLEAAQIANAERLAAAELERRALNDESPRDPAEEEVAELAEALEAAQAENARLLAFNQSLAERLDEAIAKLRAVLEPDENEVRMTGAKL